MFKGLYVAMVTPFRDGKVDHERLASLASILVEAGCDGLVPCGCTGEAATLSAEERRDVLKTVIAAASGRCRVVAGTGTNNTADSVKYSLAAKELGADAVMLITPYYNKPGPAGQYQHFKTVAEAVGLPVVLYNVPGRTGVNMLPETIWRLSEVPNIQAIKEASGSLDQVSQILSGSGITVLSGDDSLTLPMLSLGARGVISVAGNIVPELMKEMLERFFEGDVEGSRKIHFELLPLFKALFLETNPSPVKKACELLRLCSGDLRLPLVPVGRATEETLRGELKRLKKL
ncbi:MAG: 4-hydroxy-tetrahydrodipicolinate synthase [Candidatus Eiseniibacteriota bacterium]|nr:MAG: 4-hydroxy-tetrahydrodipicolinate synthase [Candidatus Eisenbacteria bacterium]